MNNGHYSGKYVRRVPRRVQRRHQRQFITLLVSILLVFGIAVGGTIAFIMMQTDRKTNTFDPAQVSCEVMEEFNGTVKSNVAVKNTGNTDAYIRAAVNITWMKDADSYWVLATIFIIKIKVGNLIIYKKSQKKIIEHQILRNELRREIAM